MRQACPECVERVCFGPVDESDGVCRAKQRDRGAHGTPIRWNKEGSPFRRPLLDVLPTQQEWLSGIYSNRPTDQFARYSR